MNINTINKAYIAGIGGIGVSAIAQYLHSNGIQVIGSDLNKSNTTELLEKKGIKIFYEHNSKNISNDVNLFIYSPAVPEDNPERIFAAENNIPTYSYPEFLGLLSSNNETIAISGTNGKTSTTAILGYILDKAKVDPTVIVGSIVPSWDSNLKIGKSNYFVVEACEHKAHMLNFSTKHIILTNIEPDHLDYYRDLDHIIEKFQEFSDQNDPKGYIVYNIDDPSSKKLNFNNKKTITYGIDNPADIRAINIKTFRERQFFDIEYNGKLYTEFSIAQPGKFNIYNSLGAIAMCIGLNIPIQTIRKYLYSFEGTWRRFQKLGEYKQALIISDYGHHPTAVQKTINGVKEFYPDRRLITVFQPHQHNRTKNLFNEFVNSFDNSDIVILPEIFDVTGREEQDDQDISSADIRNELAKRGFIAEYAENFDKTKKLIDKYIQKNDVLLIMGAGDIYLLAEKLAK